ncbi:MAG TPA: ABC transporter ATP-binding protein [Pirellulales bacterium]
MNSFTRPSGPHQGPRGPAGSPSSYAAGRAAAGAIRDAGEVDPAAEVDPDVSLNIEVEAGAGARATPDLVPLLMRARGIVKSYRKGKLEVPVLRSVDVDVRAGEFLAIMGSSGSGKSTLLHLLATLDQPDQGEIHLGDKRIDRLNQRGRDQLRNQTLGMIFQAYHLLPELTALENVLSPLMITHGFFSWQRHKAECKAKAEALLKTVGLEHRLHHKPRELSGGEMQRTAIARALIHEPKILLADEPTGNLDRGTGSEILRLLRTLNRRNGLTIIMVTHDAAIARQADRQVRLVEGRLEV